MTSTNPMFACSACSTQSCIEVATVADAEPHHQYEACDLLRHIMHVKYKPQAFCSCVHGLAVAKQKLRCCGRKWLFSCNMRDVSCINHLQDCDQTDLVEFSRLSFICDSSLSCCLCNGPRQQVHVMPLQISCRSCCMLMSTALHTYSQFQLA